MVVRHVVSGLGCSQGDAFCTCGSLEWDLRAAVCLMLPPAWVLLLRQYEVLQCPHVHTMYSVLGQVQHVIV